MSVERKIRELMQKTSDQNLTEAASALGADGIKKDQSIPAQNAGDVVQPKQGSSADASYEVRDEEEENQGAVASKSTPNSPRPMNTGPGNAPNYTTVGDPTSVVNMPASRGNVPMEAVDYDSELKTILGEDVSEEFKTKASSLFEAAVIARVNSEMESIREQLQEQATQQIEEAKKEMVENVDAYLSYVVEQWMKENELAIDKGLRTEIAEDFISGLKTLFQEHYVEVPEEKYDVLDEMQQTLDDLKQKLDESINNNVELTKEVVELKKARIFESATKDLAETEVEKLRKLTSNIEFDSDELFEEKLQVVKETYFPRNGKTSAEQLTEDVTTPSSFESSGPMSTYVNALSRSLKR